MISAIWLKLTWQVYNEMSALLIEAYHSEASDISYELHLLNYIFWLV